MKNMPIVNDECDVCYGSRFLHQAAKGYMANRLANKGLTAMSNLFTHLHLTDMETCYKCFRREVIQSVDIQENRFGFEPALAFEALQGFRDAGAVPGLAIERVVAQPAARSASCKQKCQYYIWKETPHLISNNLLSPVEESNTPSLARAMLYSGRP